MVTQEMQELQKMADKIKADIESGKEGVDFQNLPAQLGFTIIKMVVHGSSLGEMSEDAGVRALDADERETLERAGSLGKVFWGPKVTSMTRAVSTIREATDQTVKEVKEESMEYQLIEAFNAVRRYGQQIGNLYRAATLPYGHVSLSVGDDGETQKIGRQGGDRSRMIATEEIPALMAMVNALEAERNKAADFFVEHWDNGIAIQKQNLIDYFEKEARKAFKAGRIGSPDLCPDKETNYTAYAAYRDQVVADHVDYCLGIVEKATPTADQYRSAVRVTVKQSHMVTPQHVLNDPKQQEACKEEWEATCAAAALATKKEVLDVLKGAYDNSSIQVDSMEKIKAALAQAYKRNVFVGSDALGNAIDGLRKWLVKSDCYPEAMTTTVEKDGETTTVAKYPSEAKAKAALKAAVSEIREQHLEQWKSQLFAAITSIESGNVFKANPFAMKGRVLV